jgi:hypothetical protein
MIWWFHGAFDQIRGEKKTLGFWGFEGEVKKKTS